MASPHKTPAQRISEIMHTLQTLPAVQANQERFEEVCAQVISVPPKLRPTSLPTLVAQVFGKPLTLVNSYLRTRAHQVDFDTLVPKSGWLHDYIEWTRQTEPPTVFHFFVAATAIGASLGRRIFFDKGGYQVFPNLFVMLLAPSGRCRKTSAANLGTSILKKSGGSLLADKVTPEALLDTLQTTANALVYAPELAVFLGKQKYQEGMVPLLTALADCPDEFTTKTIGRGETTLVKVALSLLLCSTVDWLQSSVPPDVFGGGFMSRFIFIVQESTPRCFPLPPPLDPEVKKALILRLAKYRSVKGEVTLTLKARRWYEHWYRTNRTHGGDKLFAGYFERKPDHLLRIAMICAVSQDGGLVLDEPALIHSSKILTWLEDWLPAAFDQLSGSVVGEDQARLLRQLRQAGGSVEHSVLLRKNSTRMNADQFKRALGTLREAKLVEWNAGERKYYLTPEGWG